MSINIVILGNGISAQLFMSYLKYHIDTDYSCLVLEKNKVSEDYLDDVPFYFNKVIDDFSSFYLPITVEMGIYDSGDIIYKGNEYLAEKYALKVLGSNSDNTIKFIEREKKAYVIKNSEGNLGRKMAFYSELFDLNSDNNYLFNTEIVGVDVSNKKVYTSKGEEIKYDFLISTIPLQDFNSITRQCVDTILDAYPFYVNRFQVNVDNKYQVLYCTDDKIRFSRLAKLNDTIYLESREKIDFECLTLEEEKFINLIFNPVDVPKKSYISYPGRFKQIDDDVFKKVIECYRKSNIFLLGRMATWRFKLVEDIYEDCKEICKWIF